VVQDHGHCPIIGDRYLILIEEKYMEKYHGHSKMRFKTVTESQTVTSKWSPGSVIDFIRGHTGDLWKPSTGIKIYRLTPRFARYSFWSSCPKSVVPTQSRRYLLRWSRKPLETLSPCIPDNEHLVYHVKILWKPDAGCPWITYTYDQNVRALTK
jgi:hypothetical protein